MSGLVGVEKHATRSTRGAARSEVDGPVIIKGCQGDGRPSVSVEQVERAGNGTGIPEDSETVNRPLVNSASRTFSDFELFMGSQGWQPTRAVHGHPGRESRAGGVS